MVHVFEDIVAIPDFILLDGLVFGNGHKYLFEIVIEQVITVFVFHIEVAGLLEHADDIITVELADRLSYDGLGISIGADGSGNA